ncbi:MAG: PKD domain-containing protein [Ferruginibacter sp.]
MTKATLKNIFFAAITLFFYCQSFAQYTVNGNALQVSCNQYRLTDSLGGQTGSVWNNNKINLSQSFDFNFDVFLGTHDSPGADGIAFVLQPISTSVGSQGSGLGYQGISPAVGVTIDTYQNSSPDNDPFYDHIAIQLNGDLNHSTANNIAGPVTVINGNNNVEDGTWHSLRIQWDAATNTLTASIDGTVRVTAVRDFINTVFAGNPLVYWGFTGSTGGENNYQGFKTALSPNFYFPIGQKFCVNQPVNFINNTVSFSTISKFYWDFGDGSPLDSVNINPVHTYTTGNDYIVKLKIIGADGCIATHAQTVRVGTKPNVDFISTGGICAPTGNGTSNPPAQVTDVSSVTVGTLLYHYWDFGGGQIFNGTQNAINFNYATPGDKLIRHVVTTQEGCVSDTLDKTIHIYGHPIADFTFTDSVCLGQPTSFFATIGQALGDTANLSWTWVINGATNSFPNIQNPVITFPSPGAQNVLLIAFPTYTGMGCYTPVIKSPFVVNKPAAYFTTGNIICQSAATIFTDSSYTSDNVPISQWWWRVNGGITGTQKTITTIYNNAGTDTVKLVVHNSKGCASDTLKKVITVNPKPLAKFGISAPLCNGLSVQFSDSSTVTGSSISAWSWVYNNTQWSTQQNTSNTFTTGSQTAGLVVTSGLGCKSDTAYKTFYINPVPDVTISFKDACKFAPVSFSAVDNSNTVTQWKWEFGDGGIANTQNASHAYNANGTYKVKLFATAASTGCYDGKLEKDIHIYGTNAFAGNDTIAAAGQPVMLHASGGLSYTWSPANLLNDASSATPIAILNSTQIFTLKAFTPEGCESYDDVVVKIYKGPDIYLPNAFTPNGDGRNDIFRGVPVGLQEFEYLKVFNRWGQLVFYTNDYRNGWDGMFLSQKQPGGVYVVMARGKDYLGNTIAKKGTVMLIR